MGSHCTWCTSDFRAIKAFEAGFQVGVCNFHSPRHCGGSTAFPRLPPHHSVSSFSLYLSLSFIPSSPLFLSVDLLSELHRFFRSCRLAVRNITTSTGREGGREGGRLSLSTAHTAAQPQLTRFAYLLRSLPSFFVRSRLQLKGKKGESKKCACVLSRPPTQNVAEFRGRMHTCQSVAPPPALMPPFLDRFQCLF